MCLRFTVGCDDMTVTVMAARHGPAVDQPQRSLAQAASASGEEPHRLAAVPLGECEERKEEANLKGHCPGLRHTDCDCRMPSGCSDSPKTLRRLAKSVALRLPGGPHRSDPHRVWAAAANTTDVSNLGVMRHAQRTSSLS